VKRFHADLPTALGGHGHEVERSVCAVDEQSCECELRRGQLLGTLRAINSRPFNLLWT